MLGLLPMKLDTGPGTRKSSTLCSLLLLVIATFLVLKVPGQSNNDGSVGVANHKKIGKNVTLVDSTIKANETNFNSDEYRKRFPNACDVKIDNDTIELQYNNNTGCTVDLLVKNVNYNNKIKFKAGVRNKGGELGDCLDEAFIVQDSSNYIMPFVYSKNNKVVERLSHGPIYAHKEDCNKQECGMCMPWTTLEISWTRVFENVFAHTYLVGDLGPGKTDHSPSFTAEEVAINMEIESGGKFSMNFSGEKKSFDSSLDKILCVPKNNPFVAPETWTIRNENLKDKRLLVFSLLPVSATVVFDVKKLVDKRARTRCDLFVQFDRKYYELLYVPPPPPPTTTTTTTPTPKICPTKPAIKCATCPSCPTEPACATCPVCPSCPTEPAIKCTACPLCPVPPTTTSTTTTKTTTPPAPSAETNSSSSFIWIVFLVLLLISCIGTNAGWLYFNMNKNEKEKPEEEKMTRSARSIVITTANSEYGPDVNTAVQVDAESAKTAPEDGKSVTAPMGQAQTDGGETKEGEDNEAMTPVETKTLPEV